MELILQVFPWKESTNEDVKALYGVIKSFLPTFIEKHVLKAVFVVTTEIGYAIFNIRLDKIYQLPRLQEWLSSYGSFSRVCTMLAFQQLTISEKIGDQMPDHENKEYGNYLQYPLQLERFVGQFYNPMITPLCMSMTNGKRMMNYFWNIIMDEGDVEVLQIAMAHYLRNFINPNQ